MSVSGMTMKAAAQSLNGWDLQAIASHFGKSFTAMEEENTNVYAIIWIQECKRSGGRVDIKPVMDMTFGEIAGYFDPPEEVESDKDFTSTNSLTNSLTSASQPGSALTTTTD